MAKLDTGNIFFAFVPINLDADITGSHACNGPKWFYTDSPQGRRINKFTCFNIVMQERIYS